MTNEDASEKLEQQLQGSGTSPLDRAMELFAKKELPFTEQELLRRIEKEEGSSFEQVLLELQRAAERRQP